MTDIITSFAEGFTGIIEPLATGIKNGFSSLLYVDPTATTKVLSDVAKVGLAIGGMGLAIGLVMGVFAFIKHLRG